MITAPAQPNEKRVMVIWRRPSLGPIVEKKATGREPRILKSMIAATLSQNPRPNIGMAIAPRATVEITRFAENQMVKLSEMCTCARALGETRSIPCVSILCSSGMEIVSEAIESSLLVRKNLAQHIWHVIFLQPRVNSLQTSVSLDLCSAANLAKPL